MNDVEVQHLDYDKDAIKHYVRLRGWLPPSLERAKHVSKLNKKRPRPVRYFTFCAAGAVDVFMLENAGILRRSNDGKLLETYFCEADPAAFATIRELIQSPEQGFFGKFEDIVLFEDRGSTRDRTYADLEAKGRTSSELRRMLLIKDRNEKLRAAFPFDIINLDATGTLLPPREPPWSRLMQAINHVLQWQTEANLPQGGRVEQFSFFLTTRVDRDNTNQAAINDLARFLQDNLDKTSGFREKWGSEFGPVSPSALADSDFVRFFTTAVPKWFVERGGQLGWDVVCDGRFVYERRTAPNPYMMMSEVLTFTRVSPPSPTSLFDDTGLHTHKSYVHAQQRLMEVCWQSCHRPDSAVSNRSTRKSVMDNLKTVVDYRAKVVQEFGLMI